MIQHTKSKFKGPQNRLQSLENQGFIQLFLLILILVFLLIKFGIDPKGVWENILKPIVEWGFNTTVRILGFLFDIAIWIISKFKDVLGL
jgi:hypothetical protein